MTQARPVSRLPSRDGWRALSSGLVLGAHPMRTVGFSAAFEPLLNRLFDGDIAARGGIISIRRALQILLRAYFRRL
jgi:hypothetical protein